MERLDVYRVRLLSVCLVAVMVLGGTHAKADYVFGEPTNLGSSINSPYNEEVMAMPADGLSVFFVSNRPGGYGHYDIWVAKRQSTEDPWGEPENLGPTINSAYPEFYVSISPDGLTLYYSDGPPYWAHRPGGLGKGDIWVTRRASVADPWTAPVNIGAPVNSSDTDAFPSISADGLILVFTRDYSYRQPELWLATRKRTSDPWDTPLKLADVNSGWDYAGSISGDGHTLFWFRGGDVDDNYMATRAATHEDFGNLVKLPYPVNTDSLDGMPYISPDGSVFYLVSDRPGGFGGHDLWQVSIDPVVDFNADGTVDKTEMGIMVDHWGEDYSLCDIGPVPWGDGIVDVQDLIVLAKHLLPVFLAHWELDETEGHVAYDSIGGHDGTLNGNPLWRPAGGKVNGALLLDGIDDYVSADFAWNTWKMIISATAWIKGGAPGQVIISQADGSGYGASWLYADSSGGKLTTKLMDPQPALVSESMITDGAWHHIGLVWDGSFRHLYVDGAEVARDAATLSYTTPCDGGLYWGVGKNLDAGSFFSGMIDDVRIYNKALTPEEIAALVQ